MSSTASTVVELADPDTWPRRFRDLEQRVAAGGRLEECALHPDRRSAVHRGPRGVVAPGVPLHALDAD
jgi:hypothetical protein